MFCHDRICSFLSRKVIIVIWIHRWNWLSMYYQLLGKQLVVRCILIYMLVILHPIGCQLLTINLEYWCDKVALKFFWWVLLWCVWKIVHNFFILCVSEVHFCINLMASGHYVISKISWLFMFVGLCFCCQDWLYYERQRWWAFKADVVWRLKFWHTECSLLESLTWWFVKPK